MEYKDWKKNNIINGREYSKYYPHLPVGTFEEWIEAITTVFKLVR
jgi:hypothetical protein